jgi:hypothetical protein
MSSTSRSAPHQDEKNPYRAPRADTGPAAAGVPDLQENVEEIRKTHLGREASIKSLGTMHLLAAGLEVLLLLGSIAYFFLANFARLDAEGVILIALIVGYSFSASLNYALGSGLRKLKPWARWTESVFMAIGLFVALLLCAIDLITQDYEELFGSGLGGLFLAYLLYLLVSPKAAVVFSREYREVIEKTPHLKYRTSVLVKIAAALLLGLIGLAILGVAISGR